MFRIEAIFKENFYELYISKEGFSQKNYIDPREIFGLFDVTKAIIESNEIDSRKNYAIGVWNSFIKGERIFTGSHNLIASSFKNELSSEDLIRFIKRIMYLDSPRLTSFIEDGAKDFYFTFALESRVVNYPYTCGAFIISPSMQGASDFLTCIGANRAFVRKELNEILQWGEIQKIISLNQFLLATNSGIGENRSMCIITDSDNEDFTSSIFGEMNIVSFDIMNSKTENFLRTRIFESEDLKEFLLNEINEELKKEKTKELWEKLILELTELDQTLKFLLRTIEGMSTQQTTSQEARRVLERYLV